MNPVSSSTRSGERERTTLLSRPPMKRWPDGVIHHGSRGALLLLLAFTVALLLPSSQGRRVANYEAGQVSSAEIIASINFEVPKNTQELERERSSAAAVVPLTFRVDPGAPGRMEAALDSFFAGVGRVEGAPEPDVALNSYLERMGLQIPPDRRSLLLDDGVRNQLRNTSRRAVRELLPPGVLDETVGLDASSRGRILIVDQEGTERFAPVETVRTTREFFQEAAQLLPAGTGSEVNELFRLALIRFMSPSLRFDWETTEGERQAARLAVPTVKGTVLQGEAIVRANQRVGEAEVERLQAYEEALRAQEGNLGGRALNFVGFSGSLLVNLLILSVFGMLVFFYFPEVYRNYRWLLLLGGLTFAFAGAGGIIAKHQLPVELLPIAFVALSTAVLWDGRLALALVVMLAALTGAQLPFQSVNAWLPVFVAGAAASLSVRAVRRRFQTWIFIAIIAASYLAILAALGAVYGRGLDEVITGFSWAAGNAVMSAILALGFLPVFEWFTRITTDQTLLEWADPNRPLLKRLSMEAPGTYAHTINVANLSEAAANAIGANGLLCRVGVYYHDVGKMVRPHFFIENQPSGRNPHDRLKAATSAAVVREHVLEGMRLAQEARLPEVLIDFIPEHHGTQVISYFLERARKDAAEGEVIDPEEYRYPGPRPQSRETAIVMLADSVESATRVLQDATPDRIRELIDTIVEDKIRQGQLEEAPLTLREIGAIKAQFRKVLAGAFHHRIDHPATRHLTGSPRPTSNEAAPPGEAAPPLTESAPAEEVASALPDSGES